MHALRVCSRIRAPGHAWQALRSPATKAEGPSRRVCCHSYSTSAPEGPVEGDTPLIHSVEWAQEDTNFISIIGNLGGQPTIREFPSGKAVASMNIAMNNASDRTKDNTTWIQVESWDALAREMAQLQKGQQVRVWGRINQKQWVDKTTQMKRQSLFINARDIACVLSFQGDSSHNQQGYQQQGSSNQSVHPSPQQNYQAPQQNYQPVQSAQPYQPAQGTQQAYQPQRAQDNMSDAEQIAKKQADNARREELWKDLLSDPIQFWDNRTTKTNVRAPDWKHKETGIGLWISSAPAWWLEQSGIASN